MLKIKLTTSFPDWNLLRQTPDSKGVWENCQFFVNQEVEECDFWVVFEGLFQEEQTKCPPENTIFITGEPPSIKTYPKKFLAQFGTIITSHKNLKHPNFINIQQGLPWMIGGRFLQSEKKWSENFTKSYDELKKINPEKTKLLSVISSNKTNTKGHRQRLKFVEALQNYFGDQIDVFGRGLKDFEDKWEVIAPYKYHIALENSSYDDYWTEKLADTFLANTYPFYYGCRNLDQYFSEKSFTRIDINNPNEAIRIIEESVKNNLFETSQANLKEAKNLVLDKYNVFPMLADLTKQINGQKEKQIVNLKPEKCYKNMLLSKLKNYFKLIFR